MPRTRPKPAAAEPTPFRVAAYLRVSTEEQARSGLGLDAQRARCLAMAAVKGWPEPVIYADEGVSGTADAANRPALAHLLADVRSGELRAVLILSLDRLARKTRLVLDLVEAFTYHNVALVSCKESLDTATPQGQFVLTMFAALAQLERDLIAERTSAALAERNKRDGNTGGRVPYGYQRTAEGVIIDADAAAVVLRIFALRRRGLSLRAVAESIGRERPIGPRGGQWHHTSVREILANEPAYLGGERGASTLRWPAILSKRTTHPARTTTRKAPR